MLKREDFLRHEAPSTQWLVELFILKGTRCRGRTWPTASCCCCCVPKPRRTKLVFRRDNTATAPSIPDVVDKRRVRWYTLQSTNETTGIHLATPRWNHSCGTARWSCSWAVREWRNRSRCCLEGWLLTLVGPRKHYWIGFNVGRIHSPPRGVTRWRCGLSKFLLLFDSLLSPPSWSIQFIRSHTDLRKRCKHTYWDLWQNPVHFRAAEVAFGAIWTTERLCWQKYYDMWSNCQWMWRLWPPTRSDFI